MYGHISTHFEPQNVFNHIEVHFDDGSIGIYKSMPETIDGPNGRVSLADLISQGRVIMWVSTPTALVSKQLKW